MTVVLFTCAGQRVDIVRAFRAAGATALAADADELAPALYHADRRVLVPLIADPGYVDSIAELVREHDVRLIVPLNDLDHPRALARTRELEPAVLLLPDAEVCELMSDKLEAHAFFVERGIASPRSWAPEDVPDDARYPLLVKARQGFGSRHIYRSEDPEQLAFFLGYTDVPSFVQERLSRGGILDRRLLRPRRALPERDSTDDGHVQGRRVHQGHVDSGRSS